MSVPGDLAMCGAAGRRRVHCDPAGEELMRMAKMEGKTTFYRMMGDLARWGYIQYSPSRNKGGKSRVRVI